MTKAKRNWNKTRERIKKRDHYRCQCPDCQLAGKTDGNLVVHHINGNQADNRDCNLVTMRQDCHNRRTAALDRAACRIRDMNAQLKHYNSKQADLPWLTA